MKDKIHSSVEKNALLNSANASMKYETWDSLVGVLLVFFFWQLKLTEHFPPVWHGKETPFGEIQRGSVAQKRSI